MNPVFFLGAGTHLSVGTVAVGIEMLAEEILLMMASQLLWCRHELDQETYQAM